MPYKGGVQLLPETERRPTLASYTSGNGYFWFGVGLGLVVLVTSAIFSSYAANLQAQIDTLDGQLQATEDSRDKTQEKALLDVQKQSKNMRSLLSSKIYWSQAFDQMEKMTRLGVTLSTLNASVAKSSIEFTATADTYASVARQIKAFTDGDGTTNVTIESIKADAGAGVKFNGELTIDPTKMLNKQVAK